MNSGFKRIMCAFFILAISKVGFGQNTKYEFRACWVATVDNIDFPLKHRKGLHSDSLKNDFIAILDKHEYMGMNAVIVQVRPAADAFYASPYEPWSEWLTGTQGLPPSPYFDPLEFMIKETHKRGMEFHAWCNPYRAVFNVNNSTLSPNHITKLKPNWFVRYGDTRYFNPGNPEVWDYVTQVVTDITARYDIDAIHFDDYFYPYKIAGKEFPDGDWYAKYPRGLKKDDWRRSNVDSVILKLSQGIKKIKPYVKFGISPFGVWRNKDKDPMGSNTQAGAPNYDDLYADILLWLRKGWIDYVLPQLYWEIGHPKADFTTLIKWWSKYTYGKHLYIGHGVYRAASKTNGWRNTAELPKQLDLVRLFNKVHGSAYFSSKSFDQCPFNWVDTLANEYYAQPALVPPMPWLDKVNPPAPAIAYNKIEDNEITIAVNAGAKSEPLRRYAVYAFPNGKSLKKEFADYLFKVVSAEDCSTIDFDLNTLPLEDYKEVYIAVTALDRTNNESVISNTLRYGYSKEAGKWSIIK
jgi:uncharacterized lipoprotein YddW (UPF0748 family)